MGLRDALATADRMDARLLRTSVADGLHDAPAAFVTAYDKLMTLAAQKPPTNTQAAAHADLGVLDRIAAQQALADWTAKRDRDADQLAHQLGAALQPYGEMIETYIGPAFAERLAAFAADVDTIGPSYAAMIDPTVEVVADERREVQLAYVRFHDAASWYLRLRHSWTVLRRFDNYAPGTPDPDGLDGILAEVANAADLFPDQWRGIRAGGQGGGSLGTTGTQPWPQPVHVRLAAILRDGGRPWMPSQRQQWKAYNDLTPAPDLAGVRRDLTRPFKSLSDAGRPLA